MSAHDLYTEAKRRLAHMEEPRRGQVFAHYKGGLYSIVSLSIEKATLEPLVTYSSNRDGGDIDTTRTLREFYELVGLPGPDGRRTLMPRFRRMEG